MTPIEIWAAIWRELLKNLMADMGIQEETSVLVHGYMGLKDTLFMGINDQDGVIITFTLKSVIEQTDDSVIFTDLRLKTWERFYQTRHILEHIRTLIETVCNSVDGTKG